MALKNSAKQYGLVTKTVHWLVFLLFAGQYSTATIMEWMDDDTHVFGAGRMDWFNMHKSLGFLLLLLVFFRIVWRKTVRLPDWAKGLAEWEKRTIHYVENALYVVMVVMPLSGLTLSIAAGHPVPFFKLFVIHGLTHPVPWLANVGWLTHFILSYGIIGLLAVHIGLAVRRQWFEKDGYMRRMFTSQ